MQQRVTIGPVREEGRITGIVVAIEDVTARVEHERELAGRLAESRAPETPPTFAGPVPDTSPPETIDALTRALGDVRWRVRQDAVGGLARRGGTIVDTLVRTLREQHRNFSVLSSMLDLLALTDIDVVEPLIGLLADDDVDLRIQAALILGERRDHRAVPSLIAALDDPDPNVRFHAIEALGTLQAPEAVEAFIGIAERRDFFLAFPAMQALGADCRGVDCAETRAVAQRRVVARGGGWRRWAGWATKRSPYRLVQLLNEPNAPRRSSPTRSRASTSGMRSVSRRRAHRQCRPSQHQCPCGRRVSWTPSLVSVRTVCPGSRESWDGWAGPLSNAR